MPYEGQTGTAPDGTRVVYRGGKIYPVDQAQAPKAPALSPQDASYLKDLHEKATTAQQADAMGQRFVNTQKALGVKTGGAAGAPVIGGWVRDWRGANDPGFAQLEGITSAVAPGMRPPGAGSSSDTDVGMYVKGFTNTRVPYEANVAGSKRLNDDSVFKNAHAAFIDSWYQHKGTLLGGEQAFSQYWAKKTGGPADGGMTVQLPGGGTAVVRAR